MSDETPRDWANHPHTRKLRVLLKAQLEQAMVDLVAAARHSIDARVQGSAVRIDELQSLIAQLQGGAETKEQT